MLYQYFFSSPDTDFKPTGSRDPLGLQVIWQEAGSKVIPFLSTVSVSVRDFKIICLAHAYFKALDRPTFIRFEQLCAYIRYYYYKDEGFNGIEKVRKRYGTSPVFPITISEQKEHTLLASQITYGIWGKYNRPFTSMLLEEEFGLPKLSDAERHIFDLCKKGNFNLTEEMVASCQFLQLTTADKVFFTENLLKLPLKFGQEQACQHQNEVFELVSEYEAIKREKDFFTLLNLLQEKASDALRQALEEVRQTEKVITPLNRIFKHLQTKKLWVKSQENQALATYIEGLQPVTYDFKNPATTALQQILNSKNVWTIIEGLVHINSRVSKNRGKSPWLSLDGKKYVLNERNGAAQIDSWKRQPENDFHYFLNTYQNLFQQIEGIEGQ